MTEKPKRHIAIKLLAALLTVCAALLLLGRFGLAVSRFVIASPRLPQAFDGFRIVQLSDLHGSEFGRDNARLIEKVAGEDPDIIALTGDFLDEGRVAEELPELDALARGLARIAPVFFVSGNHDWASGAIEELAAVLEAAGVTYLRNEYLPLERNGERVILAGAEDPNGWADMETPEELVDIMSTEYPVEYKILLAHRNYWPEKYPELAVDIIFCGHAHGGIIRLPIVGGVVGTDATLFPEHVAGVYRQGQYALVVSRGLGNSVPVPRFGNTPEIVSVTLRNSQS